MIGLNLIQLVLISTCCYGSKLYPAPKWLISQFMIIPLYLKKRSVYLIEFKLTTPPLCTLTAAAQCEESTMVLSKQTFPKYIIARAII